MEHDGSNRNRSGKREGVVESRSKYATDLSCVWRRSGLTRDGTAEPNSRDQTLRRERRQGKSYFRCSAYHEQDWQQYPVDAQSAEKSDDNLHLRTILFFFSFRILNFYYLPSSKYGKRPKRHIIATDRCPSSKFDFSAVISLPPFSCNGSCR